jgi:hypothetical protein
MASSRESLLAQVKYNGTMMNVIDVVNLLAAFDPSIPLTFAEAAILILGVRVPSDRRLDGTLMPLTSADLGTARVLTQERP